MKILKSKLLVALMVGGLMSGMLTFSTVSIVGQDTSSITSELQPEPAESASFWRGVGRAFTRGFAAASALAAAMIGQNNNSSDQYPTDGLD